MATEDKVWVEAEKAPKGIVLTLKDVSERRRLVKEFGVHNAYVSSTKRIGTFPAEMIDKLAQGYPIRFRMNLRAYESLLESKNVERLGDFSAGDSYNQTDYTHYIIVDTKDGPLIESGWSYKEDAADHLRDLPKQIRGRVMTRSGAKRLGLDPDPNRSWLQGSLG